MDLDIKTLFSLTMYIEAILGLLLLLAWWQNISTRAVAWWGVAHLLRSLSIALYGLYGTAADLISIDLAGALLFTSYGVTWTGVRLFHGREARPGSLAAGASAWMIACQFPGFAEAGEVRALLSGGIVATFSWLSAYEFWRGREEVLVSRWPAIILLFVHGALFLLRTPISLMLPPTTPIDRALTSAWLTVLSPEALLFTISIAFVLLAMAKERAELRHRTAALVDPLTGLANRRAFLEFAEQIRRRQVQRMRPVAVFLVDLDHFKSINDRFGHTIGDRVLQIFAKVSTANLRSTDLVGRLGGEEFAILLADANRDNAFVVADRIRRAFASTAEMVDGRPVEATISIGVAIIQDPEQDLDALIEQADQALYKAKAAGRNRVALAPMADLEAGRADGRETPAAAQIAA
ncbi:MAG: GGDEF domain-containing protein [Variibacter sp.]|nr:GGDEF domain-containing protein [Variibacter sp.]